MKPTTLPAEWAKLANAEGGVSKLAARLRISTMTLWRIAHGKLRCNPDIAGRVEKLAETHGFRSPLPKVPRGKPTKDLTVLVAIGEGLAKGWPAPERALARARELYPESQLLELAESDRTPEFVLRAVTLLLG